MESGIDDAREEGVWALFRHLDVYPTSLGEMVQLLVFVVDSDERADESPTKRRAIEWLRQASEEREQLSCPNLRCPTKNASPCDGSREEVYLP